MATDKDRSHRIDQIWHGDLFDRRSEADLIADYIKSVGNRPVFEGSSLGFTISVDADYGVGKSFFLKRLSQQLGLDHPVAFVDAWSDDLSDEPLTAIAATLKKALSSLIDKDKNVQGKWQIFSSRAGAVAKIASVGLMKRAAGFLITDAAVSALEALEANVDADDEEEIRTSSNEVVGDVVKTVSSAPKKVMDDRIAHFEAGQRAIRDLKQSISDLIQSLPAENLDVPIVIIIDELDRCRPPYAIKLLEEIKHLFDVTGVVFILGMNSDQLSRSVAGAYGPDFDGRTYLKRFVNRQYSLRTPDLEPLIVHLFETYGINRNRLGHPQISINGKLQDPTPERVIKLYMKSYDLHARDAFGIVDVVQTSLAVTGESMLALHLLMPLIVSNLKGLKGTLPSNGRFDWKFIYYSDGFDSEEQAFEPELVAREIDKRSVWASGDLIKASNENDLLALDVVRIQQNIGRSNSLSKLSSYRDLLQRVSRFSSPGT